MMSPWKNPWRTAGLFLLASAFLAPVTRAAESPIKAGRRTLQQLIDLTLAEGKSKKLAKSTREDIGISTAASAKAVTYRISDLPKGRERTFCVLTEGESETGPRAVGLLWTDTKVSISGDQKTYAALYYKSDVNGELNAVAEAKGTKEKIDSSRPAISRRVLRAFKEEKEFFLVEAASLTPLP